MSITMCPLYSGSSGNALFVQSGDVRLLVDAGLSGKAVTEALNTIGVEPGSLSGILVTHEHSDHIKGVGILSRKYDLPIYATAGTWQEMESKLGKIAPHNRVAFDKREDFYIGGLGVVPFAIPHDAADPVGYRFYAGESSVATATDMGHFSKDVESALAGVDLLVLESNHDPDMLRCNIHYSVALQKRILGNRGHLSNDQCAEALVRLVEHGTRNIILGHLSGENNTPALALKTSELRAELEGMELGRDVCIDLAYRDRIGRVYTVGGAA